MHTTTRSTPRRVRLARTLASNNNIILVTSTMACFRFRRLSDARLFAGLGGDEYLIFRESQLAWHLLERGAQRNVA